MNYKNKYVKIIYLGYKQRTFYQYHAVQLNFTEVASRKAIYLKHQKSEYNTQVLFLSLKTFCSLAEKVLLVRHVVWIRLVSEIQQCFINPDLPNLMLGDFSLII